MTLTDAFARRRPPLPDSNIFKPPEAKARAVNVEPPDLQPEAPGAAVTAIVEATTTAMIAKLRAAGELRPLETDRNRLNEIAAVVKRLTYGEMIEFGEAIWTANAGVEITQEALPAALHRWSVSR